MEEFNIPREMLSPGSEFHEPEEEMLTRYDEFVSVSLSKRPKKKKSLVNAKKLFYLLAGSATIASIGFLAK